MAVSVPIATRGGSGIKLLSWQGKLSNLDEFPSVQSKACRTMLFSPQGQYFAYVSGHSLTIVQTSPWKEVATIQNTKTYHLAFSPKETFLMTWEPFTVSNDNPQGTDNLHIYKTSTGEHVKSFVHKKQGNWEPQWTADEKLFARMSTTDVVFCEDLNFNKIVARINCHKIASYKLSPNIGTYFLVCHTPGGVGQPSFGRLFKYPNFNGQQAIANKSFFQADKVEYYWNSKGNHALLLTSTEVDKTGGSYYGKQGLHYVGINGETSIVNLSKEGPIYAVAWSPKNHEFCAIYGFMPARTTIFNLKCEAVFQFPAGARNSIYYNPTGNILLLGGFGNLRGQVEMWDVANRKQIGSCDAPDTTLLQWCEDGEHFLTATTAPRLRIANGFKIWHYTGALLSENPCAPQEELYDLCWKPFPKLTFKEPIISTKKVDGIAPSQPQASKEAYRPPSARNRPTVNFTLHDDEDSPHKPGDSSMSKASMQLKKKREAKKAKKIEEGGGKDSAGPSVVSSVQVNMTGDPEMDKKLKNIKKKLDAIEKLKEQQAQGKPLEINQLAKIKGEADLLKELKQLTV